MEQRDTPIPTGSLTDSPSLLLGVAFLKESTRLRAMAMPRPVQSVMTLPTSLLCRRSSPGLRHSTVVAIGSSSIRGRGGELKKFFHDICVTNPAASMDDAVAAQHRHGEEAHNGEEGGCLQVARPWQYSISIQALSPDGFPRTTTPQSFTHDTYLIAPPPPPL